MLWEKEKAGEKDLGVNQISVSLGKEAKEMVEGAPKTIKKDIKMEEAEELKAKLEGVGATIEIE